MRPCRVTPWFVCATASEPVGHHRREPFRVLDTVRIVARLVELAILVRRDPKPESDAKAARPPLEEFWATARIVGPSSPLRPEREAKVSGARGRLRRLSSRRLSITGVRSESNTQAKKKVAPTRRPWKSPQPSSRAAPEVAPSVVVPAALEVPAEPATDVTTTKLAARVPSPCPWRFVHHGQAAGCR